jgi:hypothetical protein
MSGSGGGGPYGASGAGSTNCDIVERVPLNSVQKAVLHSLNVGDKLAVEVKGQSLVATTSGGEVAGSLTPPRLAALLACIESGREYLAVVLKLKGALVEVEIRPQ